MNQRNFLNAPRPGLAMLILRLSLGATMLLAHGLPKLNGFPNAEFPDPLGVGAVFSLALTIFAEVICSLLLMLGLWTRLALIPLMATMFVAFFLVHSDDPFRNKELALLYLFGYTTLFAGGPGSFAVDSRFR